MRDISGQRHVDVSVELGVGRPPVRQSVGTTAIARVERFSISTATTPRLGAGVSTWWDPSHTASTGSSDTGWKGRHRGRLRADGGDVATDIAERE
jgi:hypothetical protein